MRLALKQECFCIPSDHSESGFPFFHMNIASIKTCVLLKMITASIMGLHLRKCISSFQRKNTLHCTIVPCKVSEMLFSYTTLTIEITRV